jgi:hypothetical protein
MKYTCNSQTFTKMLWRTSVTNTEEHSTKVYHSAIHFVTKAPYTAHHCDLYALVGWSMLLFVAKPTGSSSLITIATLTRSTRSSRYISLVIPKANTCFGRLSFQFSAANDWNELQKSLKLESYIYI